MIMNAIRKFFVDAINSYVASAAGAAGGIWILWEPIKAVLDNDPATTFSWGALIAAIATMFAGFKMRDHTKGIVDPK